jgi:hypothetical protein
MQVAISGTATIKQWSDREIIGDKVSLDVIDVVQRDGETIVTAKVDGKMPQRCSWVEHEPLFRAYDEAGAPVSLFWKLSS